MPKNESLCKTDKETDVWAHRCNVRGPVVNSVTQTLLSVVGLCPEQPAVWAPGQAVVPLVDFVCRSPGEFQAWWGDWGTSRSQNLWAAAGTKWGLAGPWRPGLVSLSAARSPGQQQSKVAKFSRRTVCKTAAFRHLSVTSTGRRCSRARSKVIPLKKVCRLKRSMVLRRRAGVLHKSC